MLINFKFYCGRKLKLKDLKKKYFNYIYLNELYFFKRIIMTFAELNLSLWLVQQCTFMG